MLNNIFNVLAATVSMAVFTFLVGYIPLYIKLDPGYLSLASVASMGLLVSTALSVVIPEGIETVSEASKANGEEHIRAIGVLLLAGFVLMYILDNLGSIPYIGEVFEKFYKNENDRLNQQSNLSPSIIFKSIFLSSITFGLVIHAITDGISLGTSFTRMSGFQLMFYFSLLAHKLPTSISLVTILIKENYSFSIIPFHLGLFALASPITSFITYLALSMGTTDPLAVGYLLLFSGGTFIYVVIHVVLDINTTGDHTGKGMPMQQSEDTSQFSEFTITEEEETEEILIRPKSNSLDGYQLLASLIGMSIPIIFGFLLEH